MRTLFFIIVFSGFVPCFTSAQPGVGGPGGYSAVYSVKECFKSRNYLEGFKPDSLKPNYMMKGVRIWRSVSLENKENDMIFNTNSNCTEIGLFEVIKFGVFEKQLHVFSSDEFNKAENFILDRDQVLEMITIRDSVSSPVFDSNGDAIEVYNTVKKYVMGSDVTTYLVKEDWITSSYNGKTEKYIIGLAPLRYDEKSGKTLPLFWLYYPEWKNLFSAFATRNFYSHERVSFADVFNKRYFVSQINKESNVFDRSVKSVHHGEDVYLQSELIKEKLNNAESDLFQH